jgi:hypothetical protein
MRVVHWAGFLARDEDITALGAGMQPGQSQHVRVLARRMVRRCLEAFPWTGRADLVPLFDPQDSYQPGQTIALAQVDPQGIRPDSWRCGMVKSAQVGENARQGKFQVIQVVVDGKAHWLAAALDGAQPPVFRFPPDDDELDFVAEDLTNAYLPPLAAILDVLRKNQKKLGADVSSRAFQEALAREYQSSLAKLRPIKSRLAAVDGLIDQVVYALYGLGEDEIAIIEGKSAGTIAERKE